MQKREYVLERVVVIVIGIIFGLLMSWFVRDWDRNKVMSVSQWSTFLALLAIVTEQFKANVAKLATTFFLATIIGSMVGVTMAISSRQLLWLSAVTIFALIIGLGFTTAQKRKKEEEIQSIIEEAECPYKVEGQQDDE